MTLEEASKLINDRVNLKKKTKFFTINEPYIYPILPGTKEWENFNSRNEMMAACQIPTEIVASMSTEALTLSVINHPLLDTNVLSYNDYKEGLDSFVSDFDAANGSKCTVQSKWEQEPLMKHNENYSPCNNSRTEWIR